MMKHDLLHATGILLSLASGACSSHGETEQHKNVALDVSGSVAEHFYSSDGRRFVLDEANVSLAEKSAAIDLAPEGRAASYPEAFDKPILAMTDEELAEALRPVTFINGNQYVLETPDYEAAERVRTNLLAEGDAFNPDGETKVPEGKAFCCGADGRSKIRNNTGWPQRTILAMAIPNSSSNPSWTSIAGAQCTMQLIGASTATSVAHCFHDSTNWRALSMWGAGPDAEDAQTFPSGYPGAYGCYVAYIPTAYIGSGMAAQWDYAVIDFRDTCQPTPGNVVGWLGWGTYSDATLEGATGYGYGVPTSVSSPQTFGAYPQIWGMSTTTITTPGSFEVRHEADCSPGDSGRGFRQYVSGAWRSTANHLQGPSTDSKCVDRRLDSSFNSFIVANSEF